MRRMRLTWLFSLFGLLGSVACSSSGEGGDPAPGPRMSYEKRVPGEGAYFMYAFTESNRMITSSYTGTGVVAQKVATLRQEDETEFERFFTRERVAAYKADEKPPGTSTPTPSPDSCPEERRVCSPPPPGSSVPGPCFCAPAPGSITTLRYNVNFDQLGEAAYGSFTFGEEYGPATAEMLAALESMRQQYFGK